MLQYGRVRDTRASEPPTETTTRKAKKMNTNIEVKGNEFATKASASRFAELLATFEAANSEKNRLTRECKPMSETIKTVLAEMGVTAVECGGYAASISVTNERKLNEAALAAHFGGTIPEEFYTPTETARLTVRAVKAAAVKKIA